jgi:hypothetical protein
MPMTKHGAIGLFVQALEERFQLEMDSAWGAKSEEAEAARLDGYEAIAELLQQPEALRNPPLQPLHVDEEIVRFRGNVLVRFLLDHGGIDLNRLAMVDAPAYDREQLAMLIGYSVRGFEELSYVRDETWGRVSAAVDALARTLEEEG